MGHPATGHLKTWRVGREGPGLVVGALRTATAAGTSFIIMPARESEKTSAARRPRLMEMFLQIPRVFAGCPAGVPAYLKLFE